jgi:hypothetical protein
MFIFDVNYSETVNNALAVNILQNNLPVMYFIAWNRRGDAVFAANDVIALYPNRVNTVADVFSYTAPAPTAGLDQQKFSASKVNVFPNPYYAYNAAETNRFVRFVTFNGLPTKATIRIFNLAGQLVRTINKDDDAQFTRWDLNNADNFPVASGMYIAHIDMGGIGSKVVKLAIIQEQEVLDSY